MKTTKSLKQIQLQKENDGMGNQLHNQLKEVIAGSTKSLWFLPLDENGYWEDSEFVEGDLLKNVDGKLLLGRLVLFSEEFNNQNTELGRISVCKEIFLIPEGDLLKCFKVIRYHNCPVCQEVYEDFHRFIAKDQRLDDNELDVIVNNISVDLNHSR